MEEPETIGIGQLRADTLSYLERAAAGETFQIRRRGRVVAQIESIRDGRPPTKLALADELKPHLTVPVHLDYLRSCAGRCFDMVTTGQALEIMHRGEPVARIVRCSDRPGKRRGYGN